VLLVTPLLFGLLLFAMASTIVGEQTLEDSIAGTVLLFIPNVIGGLILLFGWHVPPRVAAVATQNRVVVAAGVAGVVSGLLAMAQGQSGDPNIGGAILIMFGLILVGASAAWAFKNQGQPPPPGP